MDMQTRLKYFCQVLKLLNIIIKQQIKIKQLKYGGLSKKDKEELRQFLLSKQMEYQAQQEDGEICQKCCFCIYSDSDEESQDGSTCYKEGSPLEEVGEDTYH